MSKIKLTKTQRLFIDRLKKLDLLNSRFDLQIVNRGCVCRFGWHTLRALVRKGAVIPLEPYMSGFFKMTDVGLTAYEEDNGS